MQIISDTNKMAACIKKMKNKGSIGFVPTMGCLHEGHVSLIRKSRQKCDKIIVSIFVNPLQFGPKEDYSKYPRPKNEDILICKENGVDILFLPDEKNFYSKDFSTRIDENKVSKNFCGSFRPSHFSGVLTVVANLLNIVLPDYLFLGQKDYQQCLVIKRMIRDLNFQVKVIICPTVREKSGLAMSSRNKYLSARDKERASLIYKSLVNTKRRILENYKNLSLKNIAIFKKKLSSELNSIDGFKVQYADIVSADNLERVSKETKNVVVLVAGYFETTRLIDNIVVNFK